MVQTIQRGQIIKYVAFVVLSLIFIAMIPESSTQAASVEWCRNISIYLFALFLFQLLSYRWVLGKYVKVLPVVFLIVLYIFNMSLVVLHGYNIDQTEDTYSSRFLLNDPMITESVTIAITAIIGIFLGMTFVYVIRGKDFVKTGQYIIRDYSTTSLLLIATIGLVADLVTNVVVVIVYGYAGENIEGLPYMNVVRYFSFLLPSAVIAAFVKQSYSKETKRNILIIFVAYKFVCMMGGYRGFAMINILLIFFAYYKLCSPFKIKFYHIVLGLILLQLGSGLMVGIRESRHEGVDMSVIVNAMFDLKNSALLSLLSEFGGSLDIVNVVLAEEGSNSHHGLLGSFFDIVPGISRITGHGNEASMDSVLGLRNLGGNVIADMVYGYGKSPIFFTSLMMGLFYAFFFEMFEKALERKNPFILAFLFPILVDLIFCARSSITKMPREIVWYFLLIYFLTALFPRKRYLINNSKELA